MSTRKNTETGNDHESESAPGAIDLEEILPPANTTRWVVRRKAQVVDAVEQGVISVEDACARYSLSIEEFNTWRALIGRYGVRGLRATRIQDYRDVSRETARVEDDG